jgi:molybdopterin-guanine dinucleotide biosynthesis protein A
VVLAGGYATRFDAGDKTLALVDGQPLLERVVRGVAPAVDIVVVSCRQSQVDDFRSVLAPLVVECDTGIVVVPDPVPDGGPVAGIEAGLAPVVVDRTAILAADTPFVDTAFVSALFDRLEDRTHESTRAADGVVPRVGGYRQPTHAVYRADALESAARAADADASLRTLLDGLAINELPESTVLDLTRRRTFTDVNTVGDLQRAAALADDRRTD